MKSWGVKSLLTILTVFWCLSGQARPVVLDDPPFPFGQEVPFPWPQVEGLWKAEATNETLYLFLDVVPIQASRVEKAVRVGFVNPSRCDVWATGIAKKRAQTIAGKIQGRKGSFWMNLAVFKQGDVRNLPCAICRAQTTEKLMTLMELSDSTGNRNFYKLQKISADPNLRCKK